MELTKFGNMNTKQIEALINSFPANAQITRNPNSYRVTGPNGKVALTALRIKSDTFLIMAAPGLISKA